MEEEPLHLWPTGCTVNNASSTGQVVSLRPQEREEQEEMEEEEEVVVAVVVEEEEQQE